MASRKTSACATRSLSLTSSAGSGCPALIPAPAPRTSVTEDVDDRASRTEALRTIEFFRIFLLVAGTWCVTEGTLERALSTVWKVSFGLLGHEHWGKHSVVAFPSCSGDRELHRRCAKCSQLMGVKAAWELHCVAASLANILVRWCRAHGRWADGADKRSGCFWQIFGLVDNCSLLRWCEKSNSTDFSCEHFCNEKIRFSLKSFCVYSRYKPWPFQCLLIVAFSVNCLYHSLLLQGLLAHFRYFWDAPIGWDRNDESQRESRQKRHFFEPRQLESGNGQSIGQSLSCHCSNDQPGWRFDPRCGPTTIGMHHSSAHSCLLFWFYYYIFNLCFNGI